MRRLLLCWGIVLLGNVLVLAQSPEVSLVFSLGTHEQKIGLGVHWSPLYTHWQAHVRGQISYDFCQLGNSGHGWQMQAGLGLVFAWGQAQTESVNPFLLLLTNQTSYPMSVGYAYLAYWDQQATSQFSGMLSLGYERYLLRLENDFLAWGDYDRYRTGAVDISYWQDETLLSLRSVIWTGDPYAKENPIRYRPDFPARAGFLDLFGAPYGNCSLGLAGFRIMRTLPFGQRAFVDVGLDAEQIRNVLQNRLVHDNPLLPINWGDFKNPHVPMLDTAGNSYLYQPGQKIRPVRGYFQFGLNPSAFY